MGTSWYTHLKKRHADVKEAQMSLAHAANQVANRGNAAFGAEVIKSALYYLIKMPKIMK